MRLACNEPNLSRLNLGHSKPNLRLDAFLAELAFLGSVELV